MAQIRSKPFGVTKQGANVTEYILSNPGGLTVSVLDYGCIIKNIIVPAKNGPVDVVLGHKGQIGGRLVQLQAADDVHIYIRHAEIHTAALFQHGQHEICPFKIKAVRRAAGDVEVRPRDKRLNFCQNRARTLHHAGHARAGGI